LLIALQNTFRSFDDLVRLELSREMSICFFEAREFNFRAYEKADRRNQPDLPRFV
jgi:hypothetical protein